MSMTTSLELLLEVQRQIDDLRDGLGSSPLTMEQRICTFSATSVLYTLDRASHGCWWLTNLLLTMM
jgi:hypothetical protein